VIQRVVDAEDIPLNSKEGFLRQIIGWREFMLRVYKDDGVHLRNSNFFDFKYKMPQKILGAKSGLEILDDTIMKVQKTAYAHHIERLMVLGNLFVLLEIHPDAIFEYFMANFIDAYDWVMVGNVYAMSGFSDGGSLTTKPYIASSNYLLKMSDYKRGKWCEVVDALYWSFMDKHSYRFETNPRMAMQIALLKKMPQEKLQTHKKVAYEFKTSLGLYDITEDDTNRLIEMAWQDRLPFDVIQQQYGISENQLKKMMRSFISKKSYKRWRERVQGRKTKHTKKLDHKPDRFQGPW
jgi:deoxyribodipyrimidine photolyase-related protein